MPGAARHRTVPIARHCVHHFLANKSENSSTNNEIRRPLCTRHRKILPVPLDLSFPIIITHFFGRAALAKGLCRKAGGGRKPNAARHGAFPLARQAVLYLGRPLISTSKPYVPESKELALKTFRWLRTLKPTGVVTAVGRIENRRPSPPKTGRGGIPGTARQRAVSIAREAARQLGHRYLRGTPGDPF